MWVLCWNIWQLRDMGISALLPGSLWEPRIQGKSLNDTALLVSFNPWMEPAQYQIHVISYLNEKQCKTITQDFKEVIPFPSHTFSGDLGKHPQCLLNQDIWTTILKELFSYCL